jgi:hypothetical protein
LSTRWDAVETFESELNRTLAVLVCPSQAPGAGQLIVTDSSGQIVEVRHGSDGWVSVRNFGVGEEITAACAGAPHLDRVWHVYVGTKSGRVLELSRASVGWTTKEIKTVEAPVINFQATDPGPTGISQLFVIDGDGRVINLWLTEEDEWVTRLIPEIEGGATEVCFDYSRTGISAILAGDKGVIYKFAQDSTGHWTGEAWTAMPVGPLDMASSADPTMKDIAVFYSGTDGIFRYLFYDFTTDEKARVPIASGTTQIIGKGSQRRFNEFFAMSAGEFCLFEFNFDTQKWDKFPMAKVTSPAVSVAFGPGRGGSLSQIYVASVDGRIYEFVRQEVKQE